MNHGTTAEKRLDSYEALFGRGEGEDLLQEVLEMERNSEWIPDIPGASLHLIALEEQADTQTQAERFSLDKDLTRDTIIRGTKLVLDTPRGYTLLRDTARQDICETAKLSGSALGRMSPELFAATINNGLSVSKGKTLILMRYGKTAALHSNADGGYDIMPISDLLKIADEAITRRFSYGVFTGGSNSHSYTSATWQLPTMKLRLQQTYAGALGDVGSLYNTRAMTPAVRFASSDTAFNSASLDPVFCLPDGTAVRFVTGVRVRHTKRRKHGKELTAVDVYRDEADNLFSRFMESAEVIGKLSSVTISHGCNAVVSVCRKLSIPKRYGEAARREMERLTCGDRSVTAHDLYLCLYESVAEARRSGASSLTVRNLEEAIPKALKADWAEHDVGGLVAW